MKNHKLCLTIIVGLIITIIFISFDARRQLKKYEELNPTTVTEIEYRDQLITQAIFDTVYLDRYDTVALHIVNTDTAFCTLYDTLQVEVPISVYEFDTITPDSCRISASLRGFDVSLDTLSITYPKNVSTTVIYEPERKWHFGFGFALGFGYVK